jgi:hypothetical protein
MPKAEWPLAARSAGTAIHASTPAGDQTVRRVERRIDIPLIRYPITEIIARIFPNWIAVPSKE